MCSPNDLFNLLGKIENKRIRKGLLRWCCESVCSERTECIDPLLNALEGNESFKHLKDVAIKRAFKSGS